MASSIAAEHSSKSHGAGRPSQKAHKSPLCDLRLSEEWHANGRPTKRPAPRDEEAEDRLIYKQMQSQQSRMMPLQLPRRMM